jgi:hypothetical protein
VSKVKITEDDFRRAAKSRSGRCLRSAQKSGRDEVYNEDKVHVG